MSSLNIIPADFESAYHSDLYYQQQVEAEYYQWEAQQAAALAPVVQIVHRHFTGYACGPQSFGRATGKESGCHRLHHFKIEHAYTKFCYT